MILAGKSNTSKILSNAVTEYVFAIQRVIIILREKFQKILTDTGIIFSQEKKIKMQFFSKVYLNFMIIMVLKIISKYDF